MALQITIDCAPEDFDWLRNKIVPVVEELVDEQKERLDEPEKAIVSWEEVE